MSTNDALVRAILEKAEDVDGKKKLTCAKALQLAEQFGVEPIEVGKTCNRQGVKLCCCQLGCFK